MLNKEETELIKVLFTNSPQMLLIIMSFISGIAICYFAFLKGKLTTPKISTELALYKEKIQKCNIENRGIKEELKKLKVLFAQMNKEIKEELDLFHEENKEEIKLLKLRLKESK